MREVLRRLYVGSRDRAGLRRRRGQRRDVGLVPVQRARLLPAAGRQPVLRGRLAAVQRRRPCSWPTARELVVSAPRNSAPQRVRAGPAAEREPLGSRRTCATRTWPAAGRSSSTMGPRAVGLGHGRSDALRRRSRAATSGPSRSTDLTRRLRRSAVRRHVGHRGDRVVGRVGVPGAPSACGSTRSPPGRPRAPTRATGSSRARATGSAGRCSTRGVASASVALADAARSSSRGPARTPRTGSASRGRRRSPRSSCSTTGR